MLNLTWKQALAWRVRRQYLEKRAPKGGMDAVVSRLCGLHAQIMSSAELTLWARVENFDRHAVQQALWQERKLVKTWAMRGTLHLLPTNELSLWQTALSSTPRYLRAASWQSYFGITVEELDALTEAIGLALDGQHLTREELRDEVGRVTGLPVLASKIVNDSWGTILRPAAFTGRLCFAPGIGQRVRFTHPKSWLRDLPAPIDPQTASAAITRRFLSAYGPATYHDLSRWWNSGVAIARRWIDSLAEAVTQVNLDGVTAWMLTSDVSELKGHVPARSARLLPGFDQYVVTASPHAEHLLPADALRRAIYRPQGWISPVLLVNGMMQGIWKHQLKNGRLEVLIEPFGKVPVWARREVTQEAERLALFFGHDLQLAWKT